jgi:hypothetical protein
MSKYHFPFFLATLADTVYSRPLYLGMRICIIIEFFRPLMIVRSI